MILTMTRTVKHNVKAWFTYEALLSDCPKMRKNRIVGSIPSTRSRLRQGFAETGQPAP